MIVKRVMRAVLSAAALTALVSCEDMLNPDPEKEKLGLELPTESVFEAAGLYAGSAAATPAIDLSEEGNDDLILDAVQWMTASSGANLTANTDYHLVLDDGAQIPYSGKISLNPAGKEGVTLSIEKKKGTSGTERVINFAYSSGIGFVLENITLTLQAGITLTGEGNKNSSLVTVNKGGTLELNKGSAIKDYESISTGGGAVKVTGSSGGVYDYEAQAWVYNPVRARLFIRGGSITGCKANNYGAAVYMNGYSDFEMTSGEITGNTKNAVGPCTSAIWTSQKTSSIKISGGTIRNTHPDGHYVDIMVDISSNAGEHPKALTLAGNPSIGSIGLYASAYYSSPIWLERNFTGSGITLFINDPSPTRWFTITETYGALPSPFTRVVLKWADETANDAAWQGGQGPYPVSMFNEIKYYYYSWGATALQDFSAKNYHLDAVTGRFEPNVVAPAL